MATCAWNYGQLSGERTAWKSKYVTYEETLRKHRVEVSLPGLQHAFTRAYRRTPLENTYFPNANLQVILYVSFKILMKLLRNKRRLQGKVNIPH